MTLHATLLVALALFSMGLYGALTRRNLIGILIGVELMANGVNINLVAFARYGAGLDGQVFALFSIALTVAEVVVGLALVILVYRRHRDALAEAASELSG